MADASRLIVYSGGQPLCGRLLSLCLYYNTLCSIVQEFYYFCLRWQISILKATDFIIFFRAVLKETSITCKRFDDAKSVLNSLYYYAIEKGIVEYNPLKEINPHGEFILMKDGRQLTTVNYHATFDIASVNLRKSIVPRLWRFHNRRHA